MTTPNFFFVNDPDPEPPEGYDASGCQCKPGDNRYTLEIEEGQVTLIHTACGKQPSASWGDWGDLIYMDAIPVTVEWVPECGGFTWHGLNSCDCGATIRVTPTKETSK